MISLKLDTAFWNFVPGYACDTERNINPVVFNRGGASGMFFFTNTFWGS